ncbi:LssY C-terminal domain-containing protein [Ancylobacter terrae]|uniref:LssY C-terminal domain-containing protein n=1 Tax=Ancylobacter sp. sgz301288 TaxID=3342077 RepID=UPI00385DC4CA
MAVGGADGGSGRHRRRRRLLAWIAGGLLIWAAAAYILLPIAWTHHERQPGLADKPMVTRTKQGIPGDAINVGLVGSKEDIIRAMAAAGWRPADPVTLRSSIDIIGSVVLDRPDPQAPVSPLYYDGRVEDLAFEKELGRSADRRDHVRFWKVLNDGIEGRPVWLGAATFDRGVGLSHYTGQVTHHIGPDIDAVRDLLVGDLEKAAMVTAVYQVTGVGPTVDGRNGGGDRYYTDGEVWIARLTVDGARDPNPPERIPAPPLVAAKDAVWRGVADLVAP